MFLSWFQSFHLTFLRILYFYPIALWIPLISAQKRKKNSNRRPTDFKQQLEDTQSNNAAVTKLIYGNDAVFVCTMTRKEIASVYWERERENRKSIFKVRVYLFSLFIVSSYSYFDTICVILKCFFMSDAQWKKWFGAVSSCARWRKPFENCINLCWTQNLSGILCWA